MHVLPQVHERLPSKRKYHFEWTKYTNQGPSTRIKAPSRRGIFPSTRKIFPSTRKKHKKWVSQVDGSKKVFVFGRYVSSGFEASPTWVLPSRRNSEVLGWGPIGPHGAPRGPMGPHGAPRSPVGPMGPHGAPCPQQGAQGAQGAKFFSTREARDLSHEVWDGRMSNPAPASCQMEPWRPFHGFFEFL